MENMNTIKLRLNPETTQLLSKFIPNTADVRIMKRRWFRNGRIIETNKRIGFCLDYNEDDSVYLTIGIDTDFVKIAAEHVAMLIPVIKSSFGIIKAWAEKVGVWSMDIVKDEKQITIEDGDAVTLIYVIGDNDPIIDTIIVGENKLGENVDDMLKNMGTAKSARTSVSVFGSRVDINFYIDKVVKGADISESTDHNDELENYEFNNNSLK